MEVISPVHGKITYDENEIIKFEKTILGFDKSKRFILKDVNENDFFKILQSVDEPEVGFIVISPFEVENNYEINLNNEVINTLKIKEANNVLLYSLVTLNSKIEDITVNLKAPIVININNKKATTKLCFVAASLLSCWNHLLSGVKY